MTTGVGRKPTDADYGLGEHAFDADRLGLLDEDELTERLARAFSMPGYRPPRLPAVATQLLSLSQRVEVEFSEMQSVLERDAMLAAEVLCLARSAHYSRSRPAATLHEALVRIGLAKLRDVVMQAAMNMRVFRSESYGVCMERLRGHSNGTAHLSRIVSRYTSIGEEQAFLCGLLHDVGIAAILLVLGDVRRGEKAPDLTMLWPAIDRAHPRAGAKIVELWKLPPEIAIVVGAHHSVHIDGFDHPMAATVCLAESLTAELDLAIAPTAESRDSEALLEKLGLGHALIDQSAGVVIERARAVLGLTERQIDLVREDARRWAEAEAGAS